MMQVQKLHIVVHLFFFPGPATPAEVVAWRNPGGARSAEAVPEVKCPAWTNHPRGRLAQKRTSAKVIEGG